MSYIVLSLVFSLIGLSAQTYLDVPYFCGFEDDAENANWKPRTSTDNTWVVGGEKEKSEDKRGLYIANNGGNDLGTSANTGYLSVCREFTLEPGEEYSISFDWKNQGIGHGELYVCWVDETENPIDRYSSATYDLPSSFNSTMVSTDLESYVLSGSSLWHNAVFDVTGSGRPTKLLFLFRSKGTSKHEASGRFFPAACIDNVQITKKYTCLRPENLKYEQIDPSRGKFTWSGGAGPFTLMYKSVFDTAKWVTVKNIQTNECPVRPLRKGAYTAKVKQVCCEDIDCTTGADTSMWTSVDIVVPYSDKSCIDFLDLNGPDVTCYTGNYTIPDLDVVTPIDFGPNSPKSRHTVHYDPQEYDVWTNYNLKTTPEDGLPSVRLGNYQTAFDLGRTESMAEAIMYRYWVNPDAPILLIKFALCLENAPHGPQANPKFNLVIADEQGENLDSVLCGRVDFVADFNDPTLKVGAITTHDGVAMLYKDWTTTGMNLQDIAGQNIYITFQSVECANTGHASYAYFTMDCMGAKISGVGCGDEMFGAIEAPDGFRYKWYPKKLVDGKTPADSTRLLEEYFNDPKFVDTLKTYTPPVLSGDELASGDGIYVCRIISKEVEDCWFELEADLDPRDVYARADIEVEYRDCKAVTKVNNKSYTETRNRHDIGECDFFQWTFTDANGRKFESSDINPELVLPPGVYNVEMLASISNGLCDDILDTVIEVLDYGPSTDTIRVRRCEADPCYTFVEGDGKTYCKTGMYQAETVDFAGCSDIVVLDLVVAKEVDVEVSDTTTDEMLPYVIRGNQYNESGEYTFTTSGAEGDCDTFWTLRLTVLPVLHIGFDRDNLPYACQGEDTVVVYSYTVDNGTMDCFDVGFDEKSVAAGFAGLSGVADSVAKGEIRIAVPADVVPGSYPATITFRGDTATAGEDVVNFNVNVYYSSSILTQKWNDVIAVDNAANNGGYEFDAYSWYCNGVLIPGATSPYLYTSNGTLQFGAEYQAMLRRTSDGESVLTCPIVAADRSGLSTSENPSVRVSPTQAAPRSRIMVDVGDEYRSATAAVFDALGRSWGVYAISPSEPYITVPAREGIYVVRITLDNGGSHIAKITVRQ